MNDPVLDVLTDPLAAAQDRADANHAIDRARLLTALPRPTVVPRRIMTRRSAFWTVAATAAAVVALGVALTVPGPSALAQTGKALRGVKSFRCSFVETVGDGADAEKESGLFYWTPTATRFETRTAEKPTNVRILIKDKPGIDIDHTTETYIRLDPAPGPHSPLLLFHELATFNGKADRGLPKRKFGEREVAGFEVDFAKVDPDQGEGTLRVWPDPVTKLPLRVELIFSELGGSMVLDGFEWDGDPAGWFDATPPKKYDDKTSTPPTVDEQTEAVVFGLKTYAKYLGTYPAVKVVYGDVTADRLFRAAGLSSLHKGPTLEETGKEEYAECHRAVRGFGWMNTFHLHNPDAAYHGKTVTPDDKAAVLFRWKLDDGTYRVVFGDLRAETVTADQLMKLEKK
jgi:outer membrane lipoprotein-sorting protein